MSDDRSPHAPPPSGGRRHAVRRGVPRGLGALLGALALVAVGCSGSTEGADSTTATTPRNGGATPQATTEDEATTSVPLVEVEDFDGEPVTMADYRGTPLLVNFWASWCPPCVAEMPDLEAVHQASEGEVAFVGVNTQDTREQASALVEETGVTYDLVRDPDGELFRAFGVFGMPTTFYVDASGDVVHQHTGLLTREDLVADLEEHLDVAVAGQP